MKKYLGWKIILLACLAVFSASVVIIAPGKLSSAEKIARDALRRGRELESYYFLLEINMEPGSPAVKNYVEVWYSSPTRFRVQFFPGPPGETAPEQILVHDGENHFIYSPEIGDYFQYRPLTSEPGFPPLLLPAILEEVEGAGEVEKIKDETDRKSYVLRYVPAKSGSYAWGKIWLDRKTLLPKKVNYYCINSVLQQEIVFHSFIKNPPMEDELFQPG